MWRTLTTEWKSFGGIAIKICLSSTISFCSYFQMSCKVNNHYNINFINWARSPALIQELCLLQIGLQMLCFHMLSILFNVHHHCKPRKKNKKTQKSEISDLVVEKLTFRWKENEKIKVTDSIIPANKKNKIINNNKF